MAASVAFHTLSASGADLDLLDRFYRDLYQAEFPDPNERESLDNMVMYLRAAEEHEHNNGYHIVIGLQDNRLIGGSISDYFAASNCGVIEFLVITPDHRGQGLGTLLLSDAETRLLADAVRCGQRLRFVNAEINDPFRRSGTPDNVDPFTRVKWWARRGYGKLDFPYVQPALSVEQGPVENLLLGVKPFGASDAAELPATAVEGFVRDYLVYAMRIEDPASSAEYRQMAEWLRAREKVRIVPLDAYVGDDPAHPVTVREIIDNADPLLHGVLDIYETTFDDSSTAIPVEAFRALLDQHGTVQPYAYHLWGLVESGAAAAAGMASFFTLPTVGFGGYLALVPPLRGTGALPTIIARIERQMVADSPRARGWYIECADDCTATIFSRQGFTELAVQYRQPPLDADEHGEAVESTPLRLMYKDFGAQYATPILQPSEFASAMHDIYRYVYDVMQPEEHPLFRTLVAGAQQSSHVPMRPRQRT